MMAWHAPLGTYDRVPALELGRDGERTHQPTNPIILCCRVNSKPNPLNASFSPVSSPCAYLMLSIFIQLPDPPPKAEAWVEGGGFDPLPGSHDGILLETVFEIGLS